MTPKLAATRPENGSASQKREAEVARQQGESIGADGVKRDVAEIEQTGEPDDDIEPPAEHDVDQHRGAEVDQVARRERQKRQGDGQGDPGEGDRRAAGDWPRPRDGRTVSPPCSPRRWSRGRRRERQPAGEDRGGGDRAPNRNACGCRARRRRCHRSAGPSTAEPGVRRPAPPRPRP